MGGAWTAGLIASGIFWPSLQPEVDPQYELLLPMQLKHRRHTMGRLPTLAKKKMINLVAEIHLIM